MSTISQKKTQFYACKKPGPTKKGSESPYTSKKRKFIQSQREKQTDLVVLKVDSHL